MASTTSAKFIIFVKCLSCGKYVGCADFLPNALIIFENVIFVLPKELLVFLGTLHHPLL